LPLPSAAGVQEACVYKLGAEAGDPLAHLFCAFLPDKTHFESEVTAKDLIVTTFPVAGWNEESRLAC